MTRTVDSIPPELTKQFLKLAKAKHEFWYDMFLICLTFGLRNSECRELTASHVDIENETIRLFDAKQVKAHITRTANKLLNEAWMIESRKWLRQELQEQGEQHASIIVRLPQSLDQVKALCDEYGLLDAHEERYQEFYQQHIESMREKAQKTAPAGRTISFKGFPQVKQIILTRMKKYASTGVLFPSLELKTARNNGHDFVARQSVYRIVQELRVKLESLSSKVKNALKGIRLGLHSCRKACVQKIVNNPVLGLSAAQLFIGHSTESMTSKYLDRSKKRQLEITEQIALIPI